MAHRLFFWDEEVGQIAQPVQMQIFEEVEPATSLLLDAFGLPIRRPKRQPVGFDLSGNPASTPP